ncbi:MAG: hypothetical protein ABI758_02640 [Candidatus Woesebacteria bacterium]
MNRIFTVFKGICLVLAFVLFTFVAVSQAKAVSVGDACPCAAGAGATCTAGNSSSVCTVQCGTKTPLTVTSVSSCNAPQCPWGANTNGTCKCPSATDACSSIGAYKCIDDPYLSQCASLSSAFPGITGCSMPGYWKAACFWPNTTDGLAACHAGEAAQSCSPPGQPPSTAGGGGAGSTPTPQPRACGEACKTTADCRNPSTGGFPVECRNSKCQLPLTGTYACPEGKSEGSICNCTAVAQCGQQCGPAVGSKPCAAGSVCGFLTPSNACKVNGVDQTAKEYCIPVNPQGGYSLKRCDTTPAVNYIAADSLVKPDGTQTGLTAANAVAACKPVCGDKVVGTGEECDWGTDNGKPGSMCDATCQMRKTCGDACTTAAQCNKHLVTLTCVPNPASSRPYCGLDAIIEDGVTIQENSTRLTKPGMWRISSTAALSGGSEIYDHENGATISFWTSSKNITLVETKATNRGKFIVSVDGNPRSVQIDQYNATTLYQQQTSIDLRTAGLSEYVCNSNVCRVASNPTSATCIEGLPPTPSALVCDLDIHWASNANPDAWKYGDMITFTANPAPSARIPSGGSIRYDGQVAAYRGTTKASDVTLTPISAGASQFQPMKVTVANSTYYFRFRYCVKTSAGVETCSNWGAWQVPN